MPQTTNNWQLSRHQGPQSRQPEEQGEPAQGRDEGEGTAVNIYKIYPSADSDEHICCTMADGPLEALELVKTVSCVECFLTSTAWAERVEE